MNMCQNPSCENKTTNPKFCSRSCAASVNNLGKRRNQVLGTKERLLNCLNCNTALKMHQYKYCSNTCQGEYRRNSSIKIWLSTGEAHAGTAKNHYVRNYIAQEQDNMCAICSCVDNWQGKPLVLILDHIDGDSTNNWRSNLRLVCPNCDSQLDTYKSKNKGNGRHARRERYAKGQSY